MPQTSRRGEADPCQWTSQTEAFRHFATHAGGTESAEHIKPLHWYIACRLVLEGGFNPDHITPRPPFVIESQRVRRRPDEGCLLAHRPDKGGVGEETVLGGLKTKNVDVVVTNPRVGPVLAVSCKGTTGAFRNLTNRMEETIGECTNLHIAYPAMVIGYYVLLRANRRTDGVKDNDVAVLPDAGGEVATDGIVRFHAALDEMTLRRGIRDEISRYEAICIVLAEPVGERAGTVFPNFPRPESRLYHGRFFSTLYQRYEERFVYGAPLLAKRQITTRRLEWAANSPVFDGRALDFEPRIAQG